MYKRRGFKITVWEADNEFDKEQIKDALSPAIVEIVGANDHVEHAEHLIQTIKERCRCYCQALPFKRYTKLMIKGIVASAVYWLNMFPNNEGVSKTLSPSAIV